MRSKKQAFLFILGFSFLWFNSCTDAASQDDEVTVWVQLDISEITESRYKIGDQPITGVFTDEIHFTRYGFYTFSRSRSVQFQAMPGMASSVKMPETLNLTIQSTHPCVDSQGLVIGGNASRFLNGRVHPASGWIKAMPAGGSRMVLHLLPTEILDVDVLECDTQDCQNGFGFSYTTIGEDPNATEEDEYGYEIVYGYDLTEVDFNTLKEIAKGGEIPLTIPITIQDINVKDFEDPPGYPASITVTYRVNGWIGPVPGDDI
jgi:hypothetical protein